jgi:hypothetical protein
MNIFWLAANIRACAEAYSDKHVVKIILEICQMLYTVHHLLDKYAFEDGYKATHTGHPMTRWVGTSPANYHKTVELGLALCEEYTMRYGKTHACRRRLQELREKEPQAWGQWPEPKGKKAKRPVEDERMYAPLLGDSEVTPVPLCMPKEFHRAHDAVTSYRLYYQGAEKAGINVWRKKRGPPAWYHMPPEMRVAMRPKTPKRLKKNNK